jgi:sigma-B regulation protein RsbU (phosphoserine phosphatase)
MTLLNNELALDNETNMFLTLFCAVFNARTGGMKFANGGHNPTYVIDPDSGPKPVPHVEGGLIGPLEDMHFENGELQLETGQVVFMYTDGVVEAMNHDQQLFGEERLEEVLNNSRRKSCSGIIEDVMQSVRDFAGEASQSDDITMCAFRWIDGHFSRH